MDKLYGILKCLSISLNISGIKCNGVCAFYIKKHNEFIPTEGDSIGNILGLSIYIDPDMTEDDLRLFDTNNNKLLDLSTHGLE